jgi:site-specific recombinase XerD
MHVEITGLGSRTKKLAGGGVRYYITAWRTQPGEPGAPVIARGDGRTLDAAREAALQDLAAPALMEKLNTLRAERQAKADQASVRRLGSVRFIDGLVTQFLAYMDSEPEPEPEERIRGRKRRKDIRGSSSAHRKVYRRYLENFRDQHGDWRVVLFERAEIIGDIVLWRDQWMGQARAPDYAISAVSALFTWARERGHTRADPTAAIRSVYQSDRSEIIWRPEHFAYARANASPAFFRFIRLAAALGMRESTLIAVPDSAVSETSVARRTKKRNKLAVVPLTIEAKAVIAEIRAAKAAIEAADRLAGRTPVVAATLAINEKGRPWTKSALDSALRRLKAIAAEDPDAPAGFRDLHLHDLRGNAATAFRKAGYRAPRIALIMGWSERQVEEMLAIYVSGDDLARAMEAELRMEQEPNLHTGLHTDAFSS